VKSQPSRRRYPIVAAKMGPAVIRLPKRLRRVRLDTDRWWRATTAPGAIPDAAAARWVLNEATRRYQLIMCPHAIVTLLGTGIFDEVNKLAAAGGHPTLATSLITGYGDMEEAKSAAQLWEVSRGRRTLEQFLADHGYHGPVEAEISSRSWREDPTPLERLVKTYESMADSGAPDVRAAHQSDERKAAEEAVLGGLGRLERAKARLVLRMARRYIPLREVGKAAFVQTIDAARAAARVLGRDLTDEGVITSPDDVYFLTFAEITGELPSDVAGTVRERRARYDEYRSLVLPDSWVGTPAPQQEPPAEDEVSEVTGLAVSAGVVDGIARVILDADPGGLAEGEILVCPTTDPSWASCFLVAGAVVIDIGGPLSHGAIVARELGIPCVIKETGFGSTDPVVWSRSTNGPKTGGA
jgi:pyruvate,water dikinase